MQRRVIFFGLAVWLIAIALFWQRHSFYFPGRPTPRGRPVRSALTLTTELAQKLQAQSDTLEGLEERLAAELNRRGPHDQGIGQRAHLRQDQEELAQTQERLRLLETERQRVKQRQERMLDQVQDEQQERVIALEGEIRRRSGELNAMEEKLNQLRASPDIHVHQEPLHELEEHHQEAQHQLQARQEELSEITEVSQRTALQIRSVAGQQQEELTRAGEALRDETQAIAQDAQELRADLQEDQRIQREADAQLSALRTQIQEARHQRDLTAQALERAQKDEATNQTLGP